VEEGAQEATRLKAEIASGKVMIFTVFFPDFFGCRHCRACQSQRLISRTAHVFHDEDLSVYVYQKQSVRGTCFLVIFCVEFAGCIRDLAAKGCSFLEVSAYRSC